VKKPVFLWAITLASLASYGTPEEVIAKAHKAASKQPESNHFFNAAMVFDWEANRLYQVYTKPERITDIALETGETLLSVAGGDSQRWTISESQSGKDQTVKRHILVKPHQLGISNNLVVTTDKRTYHIEMHSMEHVPYQASVAWKYPASSLIIDNGAAPSTKEVKPVTPMSGVGLKQLNFNYHFVASERPTWMPRRVFDDGHKTYIEFPESMQDTEAPILYGLSRSKDHEIVNYRRYRNFYIIDHLIDLGELTVGGKVPMKIGLERERG
jgi:P-type conjugative transfer protein TrbG